MRSAAASLLVIATLYCSSSGCSSVSRLAAVPEDKTTVATIYGISNARYVLDQSRPTELAAEFRRSNERELAAGRNRTVRPADYLSVSGGSDNGAFGAGLLVGWSERRDRPVFKAVTGVSTGALTAPFAFLGSGYDATLQEIYTNIDAQDVFSKRATIVALAGDSMADSAPLFGLISKYLDDQMVERIAAEYRSGRLLFVGTTNLDAAKPVIWNIGAIASSGHPNAKELIARILLASASIPGLLPPVMFDVKVGEATFQELHGDGGASAQAFLYPPSVMLTRAASSVINRKRTAYIIRNGRADVEWKQVEPRTLTLAQRAVSTLITSNGVGDMYRIFATSRRDGVNYRLALIESDFTESPGSPFDRAYMTSLFEHARAKARAGFPWRSAPPGFAQ
jgi:predicted acylesterase/phospholipase RssA